MRLDISNKNIKSLKEYFSNYKGNIDDITILYCSDNQLTTLEGCPENMTKLDCTLNQLTSLKGCPKSVTYLKCSHNQLTSLQGCPKNLTSLYRSYNQLISIYQITDIKEIHQINSTLDDFIINIKNGKIIKNFNDIKSNYLQDFYKPDGLYVQLTDIYFR